MTPNMHMVTKFLYGLSDFFIEVAEKIRVNLIYQVLPLYCQQDTWAMVEILRSVREKIK